MIDLYYLLKINIAKAYSEMTYGILNIGQYMYLFALSVNPYLFRLYSLRHYILFSIGMFFSIFNHRAILLFIMLNLLTCDYNKLDRTTKLKMFFFFLLAVSFVFVFGDWSI